MIFNYSAFDDVWGSEANYYNFKVTKEEVSLANVSGHQWYLELTTNKSFFNDAHNQLDHSPMSLISSEFETTVDKWISIETLNDDQIKITFRAIGEVKLMI